MDEQAKDFLIHSFVLYLWVERKSLSAAKGFWNNSLQFQTFTHSSNLRWTLAVFYFSKLSANITSFQFAFYWVNSSPKSMYIIVISFTFSYICLFSVIQKAVTLFWILFSQSQMRANLAWTTSHCQFGLWNIKNVAAKVNNNCTNLKRMQIERLMYSCILKKIEHL